MGLKRKRSFLDISPASSTTSFAPSPRASQSPTPQSRPFGFGMDIDKPIQSLPTSNWGAQRWARVGASDLGSRTRKRYRDNRPDAEIIHESTISKLFQAQKKHPEASPVPSKPTETRPTPISQRSTLHAFWMIPKERTLSLAPMMQTEVSQRPQRQRCEDCDRDLEPGDAMEVDMMDLDSNMFGCRSCGRHVCDTCSILGEERCCLECATNGMQR